MAVYLRNALLLDWLTLGLRSCHLRVVPGEPPEPVESLPREPAAGDEVIECGGRLVTRSFACGHHHAYSALALGMPPPAAAPANFGEILERVWWRLDRWLDRPMIEASALATAVDAVRCGVTFIIDHHSSPSAIEGSLETLRAAFDRVGITCLPCYEMSDRDGPRASEEGVEETRRYLESGRQGLVGLHASFTVGDELLKRAVDLAETFSTGVHMHVAEDPVDWADTQVRYGCGVVERLNQAGVLASGKTILAHCLHLHEFETGAHRPLSRMGGPECGEQSQQRRGHAEGRRARGAHLPRHRRAAQRHAARRAVHLARRAAFRSSGSRRGLPPPARRSPVLSKPTDSKGDGEDNLVVLDYPTRTEITEENVLSHFIYGLRSSHVVSVIARGRVVLRDRRIVTVDESEIHAVARAEARRLWEALKRGT